MGHRAVSVSVFLLVVIGTSPAAAVGAGGRDAAWSRQLRLADAIQAARRSGDVELERALFEKYLWIATRLGGDDPAGLLSRRRDPTEPVFVPKLAPAQPTSFTNATVTPLADIATTTSTITVTGMNRSLADLDLRVDIRHTFAADLDIELVSPHGTIVMITTDNGAGNDDVFAGTRFDDQASVPVTDYAFTNLTAAPWLIPEGAFGKLIGEDPNGTWTLRVTDDLGGDVGTLRSWTLYVLATPARPPQRTVAIDNATTVPIPDNDPGGASSTVQVTNAGSYVCDVNVTAFITHTFAADIDLTLVSPWGTSVVLTTDNGGGSDNVFAATTWDDSASETTTDHVYTNLTVATPLVPEGALAAFIGEDPHGTWILHAVDDASGDTGTINAWQLTLATCAEPIFLDGFEGGGTGFWSARVP